MKSLIAVMLAMLCGMPRVSQDEAKGHAHFVGPMSRFLAEGVPPAPNKNGLPFTIVLTDKGATVAPSSFELKGPKWNGSARLSLENLAYVGGHLTAGVKLQNSSGSVLEGLRLDITGAVEEYRAKDAAGKEILKTRTQEVVLPSPLVLGDMPKDETSDSVSLDAGGLVWSAETERINVSGVLSGLVLLSSWKSEEIIAPTEIETDSMGRLYIADVVGNRVVRLDAADGKNATTVAKLPDQCLGTAVNPTTGKIYATCSNRNGIFLYTPGGADAGKIDDENRDADAHFLRFDRKGNLYGATEGPIALFVNDKFRQKVEKVGEYDVAATGFDVAPDGTLAICSSNSLLLLDADHKKGKRVASGPDWHLGRVVAPRSCRYDSQNRLYVIEAGSDQEADFEYARVSVWDPQGRALRVFGFGGKPAVGDAVPLPGQIRYPLDIAVAPDGRVIIAGKESGGNSATIITVLQPF